MPRVLHLVDVSSAIYAGAVNLHSFIQGDVVETEGGYREQIIPTGGTSLLFNSIYKYLKTGPMVFCCDRVPYVKRGMFPDYKITRTHKDKILVQKQVAEYILQDCGFDVLFEEGYEADDLISSCVDKFRDDFDHVYIHTADSDLYFLVKDNVSILPTHSRAKEVNIRNYEVVIKSNEFIPYNSILFYKMIKGDSTKSLSPLKGNQKDKILSLLNNNSYVKLMGDKDFMREIIGHIVPELLLRFDLTFPLQVSIPDELIDKSNVQRIKGWAYEVRNYKIPSQKMDLSEEVKALFESGLYIM
ncbi:MAG: hypothetical protein LBS29_04645 [Endomicrobium sp.]|jgi:5'-3' exonuclease|nr:hypothetical protein [Endomicrobium sp.]